MRRFGSFFGQIVLLVMVGIVTSGYLAGENNEQKLATITRQVDDINNKLGKLKNEKKSILNDIYAFELRYEKEKIESNRIGIQLKTVNGRIWRKRREKTRLVLEIEQSHHKIRKLVRILYKVGGHTYLKLFTRVDSMDQLFKNYQYFLALIKLQMGELDKVKKNMKALDEVKSQLEVQQGRLVSLKQKKDANLRSIASLKRQKLDLIKKINKDKQKYSTLLDELKYEADNLNQMISGSTTQRHFHIDNIDHLKGKLKWPLKGKILSKFGKQRSTQFGTYTLNNGIKIKPQGSSDIRAVYAGEVVFSDYWKGYGNVVIIQHSKDFHTMYGHCAKILKNPGDAVRTGEVVAKVGDTGSTAEKALHFEIRRKVDAQDPLKWLTKK
jgi:septal ring factor EnvC (AmiA/AmiB activator)